MKLSEIAFVSLKEADETAPSAGGPVELRDLAKGRSKEIVTKYVQALWGKDRLMFNGKPFFGRGDTVSSDIEAALEEAKVRSREDGIEFELEVPDVGDLEGFQFTWKSPIDDQQEVYLGYDAANDTLLAGTDAWTSEEAFNQAWDEEFEKHVGVPFDMDDEQHQEMFNAVYKEFLELGMVGVLYELSGDPIDSAEFDLTIPGGFYKGIYKANTLKNKNIIDLRLD